jgi:hypothetical protein
VRTRRRLSFAFAASLAGIAVVAGCTNAPPTEEGGDPRFDASPPPLSPDSAACGAPDADAGSGHAWSDLYRDYFGPTGIASCAGTAGACHGDANGLGAKGSNFVCAASVSGCYSGITSTSVGLVTVGDTTDDPTTSGLYAVLRKACIGGAMPKEPASVSFTTADMKRITDWIGAGAPNN